MAFQNSVCNEKELDMTDYTVQEKQVFGYLGEILLNIWVERNHRSVAYSDVINTEANTSNWKDTARILAKRAVKRVVYFSSGIKYKRLREKMRNSKLEGVLAMNIRTCIKIFCGQIRAGAFGITAGHDIYIGKNCNFKGRNKIMLQDFVTIRPCVQIWSEGGTVKINKGSEIGERCRISIANSLEIGEKVLLSPNVYITDCDHEYRNVDIPIIDQGIVQKGQKVYIGEGSYIGINAVIVGNVKIGKHCVIGANSVVTKDVPDYCVAVGTPARIIKKIV